MSVENICFLLREVQKVDPSLSMALRISTVAGNALDKMSYTSTYFWLSVPVVYHGFWECLCLQPDY